MILDSRALREGERLGACSDLARLWWPYLVAAANGYGRMPISYRAIQSYGMADPPSEQEFHQLIQEYRANWLIFLYTDQCGDLWGQWYLTRLPTHKTKADEASPAPPDMEYKHWLVAYRQRKVHELRRLYGALPAGGEGEAADPVVDAVLATCRTAYPGTDVTMARRIVQAARSTAPAATERQILEAMRATHRREQESAALWLHTLPGAISAIVRREAALTVQAKQLVLPEGSILHTEYTDEELAVLQKKLEQERDRYLRE